jgi:plastocyanin
MSDFRQRVFLPMMMPLGVLAAIAAFAWSLSRVLLAVPELISVLVALGVAGYVLLLAAVVAARPRISSRALFSGIALGMAAVISAGVVASAAGMRPLHAEEEAAEGAEGGEAVVPPNTFVAVDIAYDAAPTQVPAGEVELTLVNQGATPHNVVIDLLGVTPVLEADAGATVSAPVTLEPGVYRYHCSIPGHEADERPAHRLVGGAGCRSQRTP